MIEILLITIISIFQKFRLISIYLHPTNIYHNSYFVRKSLEEDCDWLAVQLVQ